MNVGRLVLPVVAVSLLAFGCSGKVSSKHSGASALTGDDGGDDDGGVATGDDGGGDDAAGGDDASGQTPPSMDDVDVTGAIAELQAQLTTPPLQPYYSDGTRVEGCWLNPAGNKLTDIKKAFYCSMPLEFRLCNTIVLLSTQDSQVDERWQGFLRCEQRLDAIYQGSGAFLYDATVSATYYWLFLNDQSGLDPSQEASVVAANRPPSSGRTFVSLLGSIVTSLGAEAGDAAVQGFQDLVDEAESDAKAAGVSIG
jgi:hypothetical protein